MPIRIGLLAPLTGVAAAGGREMVEGTQFWFEQIKNEIATLQGDQSVPEAEKRDGLMQLEAALKDAKPIQFKENIALIVKYFDKLPLKQEEGPADLAFR